MHPGHRPCSTCGYCRCCAFPDRPATCLLACLLVRPPLARSSFVCLLAHTCSPACQPRSPTRLHSARLRCRPPARTLVHPLAHPLAGLSAHSFTCLVDSQLTRLPNFLLCFTLARLFGYQSALQLFLFTPSLAYLQLVCLPGRPIVHPPILLLVYLTGSNPARLARLSAVPAHSLALTHVLVVVVHAAVCWELTVNVASGLTNFEAPRKTRST